SRGRSRRHPGSNAPYARAPAGTARAGTARLPERLRAAPSRAADRARRASTSRARASGASRSRPAHAPRGSGTAASRRGPRDREQLVGRLHLLVQRAGAVGVAGLPASDHLLRLRAPDVRVDADTADAAEAEERKDEDVVAGVEVEAHLEDPPRLLEVVVRLL